MQNRIFLLVFITISVYFNVVLVSGSIYTGDGGPANWSSVYPHCGGSKQSPIDLPSICKTLYTSDFRILSRNLVYFQVPSTLKISLSDHGVQIVPAYENGKKITISIIPLGDTFVLEQIHFHWGTKNDVGSEHSIENQFYSMEAHAVHFNAKYGSFENAQDQPDGILVIGYLYKVVENVYDPGMDSLAEAFKNMQSTQTREVDISTFPPISKFFEPFQSRYITYSGSLTTPPCSESVTWIVFTDALEISAKNIQAFRDFYVMEPGLVNNFRPVQPLNDRMINGVLTVIDKMKCSLGLQN